MSLAHYGRPRRIGMITPSSNTCLEPTTYRLLGGRRDVTVHTSRVTVTRIGLDVESDRQFSTDAMVTAAQQLADAYVDVVVWNGTSGSWLGSNHDEELVATLADAVGVPATTSTLALFEALRTYGVTRLGVATPYNSAVNEQIVRNYAEHGIDVTIDGLGIEDNETFARVPQKTVADQLRRVVGGTQGVAVLCTNVYGAEIAEGFESEFRVPVFDSVAVTLWQALRLAAATTPNEGFGTLLRDGFIRAEMQRLAEILLDETSADRATLRLDMPNHGLRVDLAVGEACRPGVPSIRREGSLDQRALHTVRWLEAERRNLVQPDFRHEPTPPTALLDTYGVKAQVLGPLLHDGVMCGWLSVHSLTERSWSEADQAALDRCRLAAEKLFVTAEKLLAHAWDEEAQ